MIASILPPVNHTCFSCSSVVAPASSSLLDSHRVVCPVGSGGGNNAREHILTLEKHHGVSQVNTAGVHVLFTPQELTVTISTWKTVKIDKQLVS